MSKPGEFLREVMAIYGESGTPDLNRTLFPPLDPSAVEPWGFSLRNVPITPPFITLSEDDE